MVLYELMVMVKSATPRAQLADILRRAGTRVLDAGGVITDITSFGTRPLAYEFKSPGERHFEVRVVDRSVRRCGPSRRSPPQVEVVLARFDEEIGWLGEYADEVQTGRLGVTIYNKGPDSEELRRRLPVASQVVELPNLGREGGTYLSHIIANCAPKPSRHRKARPATSADGLCVCVRAARQMMTWPSGPSSAGVPPPSLPLLCPCSAQGSLWRHFGAMAPEP